MSLVNFDKKWDEAYGLEAHIEKVLLMLYGFWFLVDYLYKVLTEHIFWTFVIKSCHLEAPLLKVWDQVILLLRGFLWDFWAHNHQLGEHFASNWSNSKIKVTVWAIRFFIGENFKIIKSV